MKNLVKIFFLAVLPFAILSSCNNAANKSNKVVEGNPNVILLIGDGMGLSELSASFYYGDKDPVFMRFREIGLIKTSSSKEEVTDSAAGATAFSCGKKTYNGAVGLDTDSSRIENIVEILSLRGYNTGIISTSSVTHATPAAFYAHVPSRRMQYDIAEQLVTSDIDFFAGGGTKWFSNREDGKDLIMALEKNGFVINQDNGKDLVRDNKYGYLLAENGMPTMLENRGDFLPDYTQLALDYFTAKKENFFLMIEGSQIDWGGHDRNTEYLIAELLDFDKAARVAMKYAEEHENTLVIVLADHETGGFTLSGKNGGYDKIEPTFATSGHSATLIPVFAYGPSEDSFKGVYENTDIFYNIIEATSN